MKITLLLLDPIAFGGEGDMAQIHEKLASWGVTIQKITPDIYTPPELPKKLVWRSAESGKDDASFTAGDLDWGKF